MLAHALICQSACCTLENYRKAHWGDLAAVGSMKLGGVPAGLPRLPIWLAQPAPKSEHDGRCHKFRCGERDYNTNQQIGIASSTGSGG